MNKTGTVKKVVTLGQYELHVLIKRVTGRLKTGKPTVTFGGNQVSLSMPVTVASGSGNANIEFNWDGKGMSDAVCGDLKVNQDVTGGVKPASYPVSGTLVLTATAEQILAQPKFPLIKINLKIDPSDESWAAVQKILDDQEASAAKSSQVSILKIVRADRPRLRRAAPEDPSRGDPGRDRAEHGEEGPPGRPRRAIRSARGVTGTGSGVAWSSGTPPAARRQPRSRHTSRRSNQAAKPKAGRHASQSRPGDRHAKSQSRPPGPAKPSATPKPKPTATPPPRPEPKTEPPRLCQTHGQARAVAAVQLATGAAEVATAVVTTMWTPPDLKCSPATLSGRVPSGVVVG